MTVCLTMIVRDEAHVIARSILSAHKFFDTWCVVDTGSKDSTAKEVLEAVDGKSGQIHFSEWKGFGASRTESLGLARATGADYALVLDADEMLFGERPELDADAHSLWIRLGQGAQGASHRLFNLARDWRYEGLIHEYPTCTGEWRSRHVDSMWLESPQDGRRSHNPNKHREVAAACERAAVVDPERAARYIFHAALGWRDAGEFERAHELFMRRTTMGHGLNWEEIYISLVEAGRALHRIGRQGEAINLWLRAHALWPERCEAPRDLAVEFYNRSVAAKDVGTLYTEFHQRLEIHHG